jgi:PIN domain nuclease of toxin-antitoxin system
VLLFCDTSALLKLLIHEEGSESMVKASSSAEGIAVCRITWAESMAAFAQLDARRRQLLAGGVPPDQVAVQLDAMLPVRAEDALRCLWVYDQRSNKHFTLKTNPLQREALLAEA